MDEAADVYESDSCSEKMKFSVQSKGMIYLALERSLPGGQSIIYTVLAFALSLIFLLIRYNRRSAWNIPGREAYASF